MRRWAKLLGTGLCAAALALAAPALARQPASRPTSRPTSRPASRPVVKKPPRPRLSAGDLEVIRNMELLQNLALLGVLDLFTSVRKK
jgi:hypothetical protein